MLGFLRRIRGLLVAGAVGFAIPAAALPFVYMLGRSHAAQAAIGDQLEAALDGFEIERGELSRLNDQAATVLSEDRAWRQSTAAGIDAARAALFEATGAIQLEIRDAIPDNPVCDTGAAGVRLRNNAAAAANAGRRAGGDHADGDRGG